MSDDSLCSRNRMGASAALGRQVPIQCPVHCLRGRRQTPAQAGPMLASGPGRAVVRARAGTWKQWASQLARRRRQQQLLSLLLQARAQCSTNRTRPGTTRVPCLIFGTLPPAQASRYRGGALSVGSAGLPACLAVRRFQGSFSSTAHMQWPARWAALQCKRGKKGPLYEVPPTFGLHNGNVAGGTAFP